MPRKYRPERIGELLTEEIAKILLEEFDAPEGSVVTVTHVDVVEDLKTAQVFIGVLPDVEREEALERLTGFAGEVQYRLMKRLRIRPIPRIKFMPDVSSSVADKIDSELYKLKEEK